MDETQNNLLPANIGDPKKEESVTPQERIAFNDKYKSSLDKLIDIWFAEYNNVTHTVKNFQYLTIKTYLWVATVVFTAEMAFYSNVYSTKTLLLPLGISVNTATPLFGFLSISSLILSLSVVVLGIDTLRGRGCTERPITTPLQKLLDMLYDECDKYYDQKHKLLVLRELDKATSCHSKAATQRGKKLRCMSYGLLLSIAASLLTLLC